MTTEQKTAELRDLIETIHINKANLDNISEYKIINGTLLIELERVAKEYARQTCEDFRDWYDKLSPTDKCTVWPPAGSGGGTGLYNMSTRDIVDKFIRVQAKNKSSILDAKEPEI